MCLNSLTCFGVCLYVSFLVRSRTSIRVPKIFAWSSDAANLVGAEFIIMERIRGVALSETWDTMDTLQRYKIVDQVVQIEKELGDISFPELDPEELFCIGPFCKRTWWHGNFVDRFQSVSKDMGPCGYSCIYAMLMTFDERY